MPQLGPYEWKFGGPIPTTPGFQERVRVTDDHHGYHPSCSMAAPASATAAPQPEEVTDDHHQDLVISRIFFK